MWSTEFRNRMETMMMMSRSRSVRAPEGGVQGQCRDVRGKRRPFVHVQYCTSISTCRVQSIHTHVVLLDRLYIPCICSCPVLVACPTAAYCTVLHENSYSISLRSGCGTPEYRHRHRHQHAPPGPD